MTALYVLFRYLLCGLLIWLSSESPLRPLIANDGSREARRVAGRPSSSGLRSTLRRRASGPGPQPWHDPSFEQRYLEDGGPHIPEATNHNEEYGNCMFKWLYLRIRWRALDLVDLDEPEDLEAFRMAERICYVKTRKIWARGPARRLTKALIDLQMQQHRDKTEELRRRNGTPRPDDEMWGQNNNGNGPMGGHLDIDFAQMPKKERPSLFSVLALTKQSLFNAFASEPQKSTSRTGSGDERGKDGPLTRYLGWRLRPGSRAQPGGFGFRL